MASWQHSGKPPAAKRKGPRRKHDRRPTPALYPTAGPRAGAVDTLTRPYPLLRGKDRLSRMHRRRRIPHALRYSVPPYPDEHIRCSGTPMPTEAERTEHPACFRPNTDSASDTRDGSVQATSGNRNFRKPRNGQSHNIRKQCERIVTRPDGRAPPVVLSSPSSSDADSCNFYRIYILLKKGYYFCAVMVPVRESERDEKGIR